MIHARIEAVRPSLGAFWTNEHESNVHGGHKYGRRHGSSCFAISRTSMDRIGLRTCLGVHLPPLSRHPTVTSLVGRQRRYCSRYLLQTACNFIVITLATVFVASARYALGHAVPVLDLSLVLFTPLAEADTLLHSTSVTVFRLPINWVATSCCKIASSSRDQRRGTLGIIPFHESPESEKVVSAVGANEAGTIRVTELYQYARPSPLALWWRSVTLHEYCCVDITSATPWPC